MSRHSSERLILTAEPLAPTGNRTATAYRTPTGHMTREPQ